MEFSVIQIKYNLCVQRKERYANITTRNSLVPSQISIIEVEYSSFKQTINTFISVALLGSRWVSLALISEAVPENF